MHPRLVFDILDVTPQLPAVFGLDEAAAAGMSRHVISRGVQRGYLVRVAHGLFVTDDIWAGSGARRRHLLLTMAAVRQRPWAVISHHSAAAWWDLPLPRHLPSWVALTTDRAITTANPAGIARLEPGALPAWQVTTTPSGACVTSAARTVTDCLRCLGLSDGVAIADAAIRRGLATVEQVADVRRTQRRWPGSRTVDVGLVLVDPARETWLESVGLVKLWRLGFPLAETQVSVFSRSGDFAGRVDALWREKSLALELDGRGKYLSWPGSDAASPELTAAAVAAAVLAEKRREDDLRGTGLTVVRADSREVELDIVGVARRLQSVWDDVNRPIFTGRLVPHAKARITPDTPAPTAADLAHLLRRAPRNRRRRS